MEAKIILAIISLCLAVLSMVLSLVFHIWNLCDIKKMFSKEEGTDLLAQRDDKSSECGCSTNKRDSKR